MLKLKNIKKNYKKNKEIVEVLDNVNYEFKKNNFYCINGKSGAGKTTLIQLLGLLINPSEGDIYINNKEVSTLTDDERADLRNKNIGFVFQSFYLNPLLKAYENVMLTNYLNKKISYSENRKLASELLKKVGLEERENHFPKELSGGEQQRVAIARALANNPNIILADEPTGSLDPENEKNILDILKKLSEEGKCVIVVSHNEAVKKYADVILNLEDKSLKEVKK